MCLCVCTVGMGAWLKKNFLGKREICVFLKNCQTGPWCYSTFIVIPRPTLFSLLANRKTQQGAGIWGDVAQGKWVSRLRDRGQISIELPTDRVPVCSNFAELPSRVSVYTPTTGSAKILPAQHPVPFLSPSSSSSSSSSAVIWGS